MQKISIGATSKLALIGAHLCIPTLAYESPGISPPVLYMHTLLSLALVKATFTHVVGWYVGYLVRSSYSPTITLVYIYTTKGCVALAHLV